MFLSILSCFSFSGCRFFFSFLLEHGKMTFLWHGAYQFASRCFGSLWLLPVLRICGSLLPLCAFVPTLNRLRFLFDYECLLCRGGALRREWLWVVRCCAESFHILSSAGWSVAPTKPGTWTAIKMSTAKRTGAVRGVSLLCGVHGLSACSLVTSAVLSPSCAFKTHS